MKHPVCQFILSLAIVAMATNGAFSQIEPISSFPAKVPIMKLDNASYRLAYLGKDHLYSLRGLKVASIDEPKQIAFNPAGSYVAVRNKKGFIELWSFTEIDTKLGLIKPWKAKDAAYSSMCFSADARQFVAGTSQGNIEVYPTRTILEDKVRVPSHILENGAIPHILSMSANGFFLAAAHGGGISIWNFQKKEHRAHLANLPAKVNGVAFSEDCATFAATLDDGTVLLWDTKTWTEQQAFGLEERVTLPSLNEDGKYLAILEGGSKMRLINLRNESVVQTILHDNPVVECKFFFSYDYNKSHLLLAETNKVVFWNSGTLNPFYGKIIDEKVQAMMGDWLKMSEGEDLEAYRIRTSDENRTKQRQLFSENATTELASERVQLSNPFLGEYDPEKGAMDIGFEGINTIALPVPASEMMDFKDRGNLSFSNAVYTLNENDEFALAYVEVTNETTGKTYIYDNLGRTKMELMTQPEEDLNLLSIEVMQQVSQDEVVLQDIRTKVVEENKTENLITDNTKISVKAEVVQAVDAEGNDVLNYKVSYEYEVAQEFSAKEDFPSGGYIAQQSNAVMSMIKIVKQSFETNFAKYISPGQRLRITITGSADATPIRGRLRYSGQYGEPQMDPYYADGGLDNITITSKAGITSNSQLAYIRALGVKSELVKEVPALEQTECDYRIHVNVAKEVGGEHRRIKVEFLILDAFKK